jgi:hypothetical protein
VTPFRIVNTYVPYAENFSFGEGLSNSGILQAPNAILCDDLKFTLSLK